MHRDFLPWERAIDTLLRNRETLTPIFPIRARKIDRYSNVLAFFLFFFSLLNKTRRWKSVYENFLIHESPSNRTIEFRRSHFITVSPYRTTVKTEERLSSIGREPESGF